MTEIVRDRITTADAWSGAKIQDDASWIVYLDDGTNAEIDAALAHAKAAGASIPFSADIFPLPNFSTELENVIDRVSNGLGVVMARERYSNADCESIYWGLGAHLGRPVSQNTAQKFFSR